MWESHGMKAAVRPITLERFKEPVVAASSTAASRPQLALPAMEDDGIDCDPIGVLTIIRRKGQRGSSLEVCERLLLGR